MEDKKCVMIIDSELPLGLIANTAAVLGNTLGSHVPEVVGCDVVDKDNIAHLGVIEIPIPILKGTKDIINDLRNKLFDPEYEDLIIADFSDVGQLCKTYDEYKEKMSNTNNKDLSYLGILIYGDKKQVNKLTGSMALLR